MTKIITLNLEKYPKLKKDFEIAKQYLEDEVGFELTNVQVFINALKFFKYEAVHWTSADEEEYIKNKTSENK